MGEHLLRVFLDELATVRIRCKKCGAAVELPIEKLGTIDDELCPGKCGTILGRALPVTSIRGSPSGKLAAFARAVADLQAMGDLFTIEFPIRLDGREEPAK
jgi:hypothetical protein